MVKITVDFRFVFLERELWALSEFYDVIEPQIKYLQDQDRIRSHARWKELGYEWEDADLQLELQDLDQRAKTVFPRLLRNPFVVTLWAAWESGIPQVAADLARTKKVRRFRKLPRRSFLDSAVEYFTSTLHFPLDLDATRLARLRTLQTLRHVIAHANGEQRSVPRGQWSRLAAIVAQDATIATLEDYVIVSESFLATAHADVVGSLRELIQRVRGPAVRPLVAG